jgi:hypothetical protein
MRRLGPLSLVHYWHLNVNAKDAQARLVLTNVTGDINFGTYRTGSFIAPTQPNNDGPFETVSVGSGGVVASESNAATGFAVWYRLS